MLTKTITAALIAALEDDPERHRYRQLHRLVRADGIGEWAEALDDILTGPASQVLTEKAREEQKELTQRLRHDSWQYESTRLIQDCLKVVGVLKDPLSQKVAARSWFALFAELRNATRGHGALKTGVCSEVAPLLASSIELIISNYCGFQRPWAYLYRNLSGKYRVTRLCDDVSVFEYLKKESSCNYPDGVYIHYDKHSYVQLIKSDTDASDFYYANGKFSDKTYDSLSYITGTSLKGDSSRYLAPVTELPPSETHGAGILDVQENVFSNLPLVPEGYVHRLELESELHKVLKDDRHPVVTLVGRGGIGKTASALAVLREISSLDRFGVIIWFSARDIDLLPEGPKLVQPAVLNLDDVSGEYVRLVAPVQFSDAKFDAKQFFAGQLSKNDYGPALYVFDNFETIRNPVEVFQWLDTYIRNPNKILITTRHRDFKGDYHVEVKGMKEPECENLINTTAERLDITHIIDNEYKEEIYRESDGHPYVIKILLGEVAKDGMKRRVERIVGSSDQILDALFERTFSEMAPATKRVFLTLCAWRSAVPLLALEAVLLRPDNERMEVTAAVEKLRRLSFLDVRSGVEDENDFVSVPVTAALFGKRKLAVNPMKAAIERDSLLLQLFGATQDSEIKNGIDPHLKRLFKYIAGITQDKKESLETYLPILKFVCSKYPKAYLMLASLYEELFSLDGLQEAISAVRSYLEFAPRNSDQADHWRRLANLSARSGDMSGEIQALVEQARLPGVNIDIISDCANRINAVFSRHEVKDIIDGREIIVKTVVDVMHHRISELNATSCSRLAWLYLYLHDEENAKKFTDMGLRMEPTNEYCIKLALKLKVAVYIC
jgi:tetratricopeptide (TPR) repeat protein